MIRYIITIMSESISKEKTIRSLVKLAIESFASGFQGRHEGEHSDPEGTINMKIHNVFIAELGPELQFYTALVRSLDSSLGNMLESLAVNIAILFYDVKSSVEGTLSTEQTQKIAELLEKYRRREIKPTEEDYQELRVKPTAKHLVVKRHESDYYLFDKDTKTHYLIELKIGGDLDNKKARSEKEALLEQFAILSNSLPDKSVIKLYFATGYNRYGEGKPWRQERVRQFFADKELLIGSDFWNFICKSKDGYAIVLDEYRKNVSKIKGALDKIKHKYLGV